MFQLVWIAPIDSSHGSLCQQRFQTHDDFRVLFRPFGTVSHQLEEALHMLQVARTDLFGFIVVFGVVVAVRQT